MSTHFKGEGQPRVAIVHDWLVTPGGSERVLEALLPLFPDAPIYTLIYNPDVFEDGSISQRDIRTSYIDRLPFAHQMHRWYLPLMTHAVRGVDLSDFDMIISISHAVAHGVKTNSNQLHINYILTPARYAWQQREEYKDLWGLRARIAQGFLSYFRRWDLEAIQGVDHFVAISDWIAKNVQDAYNRDVDKVIYPPVDTVRFKPANRREDYYIVVARLVPYKRVDLIVQASNRLGLPLIVVGEGRDKQSLLRIANDGIRFLENQGDQEIGHLLSKANAFVYASREDFGIAPVEAQAAGCPVIAFAGGALPETVIDGETGILYREQTVDSLVDAIKKFEATSSSFSPQKNATHAAQFNQQRFQEQFSAFVTSVWEAHFAKVTSNK